MKMKQKSFLVFPLILGLLVFAGSCKKNDDKVIPELTTNVVTSITEANAVSGGNITSDGGALVTARGICWNTTQNPTISDHKTTNGTGIGNFTSNISGLTANTKYYIRAYATNSVGTAYGNEETFTTLVTVPTLTTAIASSITQTTAVSGGNITSDGGTEVTARGICWSTTQNPTISDSKTADGNGTGSFTSSMSGLTANTKYYIRAYATNTSGTAYGNEVAFSTLATVPLITTTYASSIAQTTAVSGGNITSDGGAPVTARGICWSTAQSPTILDSKTTDGNGSGRFTSNIVGLTANIKYYIRAYATNSVGTAYGNEISFSTFGSYTFTDTRDGNVYHTITIGNQVWMAENLRYLPSVVSPETYSYLSPCYYVYGYNGTDVAAAKATENYSTYGVLYNWFAAIDACPAGWHLPSDAEWMQLTDYLGGYTLVGGKLKETGTTHWNSPNTGATNEIGFTALPGGYYKRDNLFRNIGSYGYWWCATEDNFPDYVWYWLINSSESNIYRSKSYKESGFSVRCVRN